MVKIVVSNLNLDKIFNLQADLSRSKNSEAVSDRPVINIESVLWGVSL